MHWSYKTVHFSLKKEGLLGSAFLDEVEIEVSLNEYGHAGWELVSLMEVNDGLIAVFKQLLSQRTVPVKASALKEKAVEIETEPPTEVSSSAPTLEGTAAAAQPKEKKEGVEETDSGDADVGSIRIF
jgi:Domain of unknown function (DUF4177)